MRYVLITFQNYTRALLPYSIETLDYIAQYSNSIECIEILTVEQPEIHLSPYLPG